MARIDIKNAITGISFIEILVKIVEVKRIWGNNLHVSKILKMIESKKKRLVLKFAANYLVGLFHRKQVASAKRIAEIMGFAFLCLFGFLCKPIYSELDSPTSNVNVILSISAVEGDNTKHIQTDSDYSPRCISMNDVFWEVLFLKKSMYRIEESLLTKAPRVVLRGEGNNSEVTVLVAVGYRKRINNNARF